MHLKTLSFALTFLSLIVANAQDSSLKHSHSHNDYKQDHPLTDALKNKFSSIEVDVFLIKGELVVSHVHPVFKKQSLEIMYLKPIKELYEKQRGVIYSDAPLVLLIDIKSDAEKTYAALSILLKSYSSILTRYENGEIIQGAVTIILSGHKAHEMLQKENLRYAFIDQNLLTLEQPAQNKTYLMASEKYSNVLKWKGSGPIPEKEKKKLTAIVKCAHEQGKLIRLWASPENENVWKELLNCDVDLISTNELEKLRRFLEKK